MMHFYKYILGAETVSCYQYCTHYAGIFGYTISTDKKLLHSHCIYVYMFVPCEEHDACAHAGRPLF